MEAEVDAKYKDLNETMMDFGQIILAIKDLYANFTP